MSLVRIVRIAVHVPLLRLLLLLATRYYQSRLQVKYDAVHGTRMRTRWVTPPPSSSSSQSYVLDPINKGQDRWAGFQKEQRVRIGSRALADSLLVGTRARVRESTSTTQPSCSEAHDARRAMHIADANANA